jgi:hypothetical protein|tara:strand:+ start:193 stop:345 length:153 start_codon:yes stop_codon:yes gene_type:complete
MSVSGLNKTHLLLIANNSFGVIAGAITQNQTLRELSAPPVDQAQLQVRIF